MMAPDYSGAGVWSWRWLTGPHGTHLHPVFEAFSDGCVLPWCRADGPLLARCGAEFSRIGLEIDLVGVDSAVECAECWLLWEDDLERCRKTKGACCD